MTQRELSTSSGVGYESIKRVEGGEQKISVEQIVRLALALNRSPAELVEEATRELVERSVGPSELRDRPASPRSRSRMRI